MKSSSVELVNKIVAKLAGRTGDVETELDKVLGEFTDVEDRAALRRLTLQRLTQSMHPNSAESAQDSNDGSFPTLEGYDIIDCVGRGGMGSVYEAYQQSTGRRVAVKFMLAPLQASQTSRRRFEREVELVARLEHPNIVSILDSGIHAGQYYFVMEYVEGATLDAAIPRGECDTAKCLSIVRNIAQTVDYAHQRGVLHRDLKPSNVILDKADTPHLLDFGLAKALDDIDPERLEATLSRPGDLVGTLGYMSPEQSRGMSQAISVRSDVYSLGAIAYEMITGRLPVRIDGELVDVLSGIRDIEPQRPSSIRPDCNADIDAILLRALAKSPDHRYATAGEFAADIERHLSGLPIHARRISGFARSWRWILRHRAISTITGLALITVLTVSIVSFVRVSSARHRAESLNLAMQTMLLKVDPDSAGGQEMSIPRFLDDVANWLDTGAGGPPDVEAEVRETLGKMYLKLGPSAAKQAEAQFQRELLLLEENHGDSADIARATMWVGAAWWNEGKFAEAEGQYRRALEMRSRLFPKDSIEIAEVLHHLATCLDNEGRHSDAESLFKQALNTRIRLLGESNEETAATHIFYGLCLDKMGRTKEAIEQTRAAVDAVEKLYGASHWRVVHGIKQLAVLLTRNGDLAEAEVQWQRAVDGFTRLYGADAPRTRNAIEELAALRRRKSTH